jgi:O-antigen ligase
LVATACFAAAYGLLQQYVGKYTLVSWGYAFNQQVRTFNGQLRSFATFDDPFAYAAYLLFGIAAVAFWLRRGALAWAAASLMLVGLLFSFVRTSALILVAFGGLLLTRRGHLPSGALLMVAAAIAGAPFLVSAGASETKAYTVRTRHGTQTQTAQTGNLLLNGRVSAWQVALGKDPREWLFGRGVGKVGTAADRAKYTVAPPTTATAGTQATQAVDSGYLATVADVGIVGLVVLLGLFARLLLLSGRAAARGSDAAWVALALLVCLMLDALTRASFTGFPTAFLGLFLVGIALASAREEDESGPATATPAAR